MGVKKKEEKKQEDVIDISTLPPCKTIIVSINWHIYLGALVKYLKLADYKVISREDLQTSLKEKSLDATAKNLSIICRSKIDEIELPLRKEKKDTPRKDDFLDRFDLLIVLKGYPTSAEEIQELDVVEVIIEFCLYMRPSQHHQSLHFKRKFENYQQKLQELASANGDISPHSQPVLPEVYPEIVQELYKLALTKKKYKNALIKVREFSSEEDLEFKEEIKDEKEEVKKKDQKPPKKGEEPKEEEIDQNDPKIKFCSSFVEEIKNIVGERTRFESWKRGVRSIPLFPESPRLNLGSSQSQASLGSTDRKLEGQDKADRQEISKDDVPKNWDFSYFHASLKDLPEQACIPLSLLCCALRWICRYSLSPSLFLLESPQNDSIRILAHNDPSELKSEGRRFYLSDNFLSASLSHLLQCINIPGINRYQMPEASSTTDISAETTSIQSFSTSSPIYFERALTLLAFENMLKKVHSERHWDLGFRVFEETLPLQDFYQSYLKTTEFEPEILTEYIQRTDSLLLCVFFKTPPGRIIRKAWKTPWRVCPNFAQYISIFPNESAAVFMDIDPNLVGCIKERCKIMYPADNSVIKMIEYHIGSRKNKFSEKVLRPRFRPIVYKDGWYFGLRRPEKKKNEFWAVFNEEKLLAEMGESGLELNFTFDTGLLVKFLPGGEILQQKSGSDEENRIIFPSGSVARYHTNGTISLLMPSGEISHLSKEKLWTVTNNKGKRIGKRQRIVYPMDPISVISQIDAETLAQVTIREDLVMTLMFQDNSFAVFHEDGTRIHTSVDKNTMYIECPGYAPVRIYKDLIKARQNTIIGLGSSDSGLGAEDIMLRSNDGILIEAFLPNSTKVQSFVQKQELEAYNEFSTNRINLVTRRDGTILKTSQEGEIVFITTESREALAQNAGPSAYFYDIFTVPEERNSGVYTIRVDAGRLFTKDNEGNYFEVSTRGKAIERLAVSLNVEDTQPESPQVSEGEYIDPECKFLPPPAAIIPPRLFVIKDDSATELLEESQLAYHFKYAQGRYLKEDTKEFTAHSWISNKDAERGFMFPDSPFMRYSLPKIVSPMLQTLVLSAVPKPASYVYRKVRQFPAMDEQKRLKIENELERFELWKEEREQKRQEYMINDPRNEQEIGKYEMFLQRLSLLRESDEVKEEKEESDGISEFYVELSDEELEPIQLEYKVSKLKMEAL